MSNRREHWGELQELLTNILAAVEPALDQRNRELVSDFIENREFEVALTWVESLIEEKSIPVSVETSDAIDAARALMTLKT